jgi:hypothetical protein
VTLTEEVATAVTMAQISAVLRGRPSTRGTGEKEVVLARSVRKIMGGEREKGGRGTWWPDVLKGW